MKTDWEENNYPPAWLHDDYPLIETQYGTLFRCANCGVIYTDALDDPTPGECPINKNFQTFSNQTTEDPQSEPKPTLPEPEPALQPVEAPKDPKWIVLPDGTVRKLHQLLELIHSLGMKEVTQDSIIQLLVNEQTLGEMIRRFELAK